MFDLLRIPLMIFKRWYCKLWFRVTLYALLALGVAGVAALAEPLLPRRLTDRIGPDAVMPVLEILASSMLAVSIFSLSIMVSSHRAAADNATPRLHRLLLADTTTQSVLATFIGAFVYALTSIILFRAHIYDDSAAVVIMAVSVAVAGLVIVAMLRWIDHLSRLGSLDESLALAARCAARSLTTLAHTPTQGANPLTSDTVLPTDLTPVPAPTSGYVQMIDLAALNACVTDGNHVYVSRASGRHVLRGQPLAMVSGQISADQIDRSARAFVLGEMRSAEQDAEFAMIVMSEISSKALSPGANDPGTAIEVITRLESLLWDFATTDRPPCDLAYPRVFLPVPPPARLLEAAFAATARDGAGMIEVMIQLRQALAALASGPDPDLAMAARDLAARALAYAEAALPLEIEKETLRAITI